MPCLQGGADCQGADAATLNAGQPMRHPQKRPMVENRREGMAALWGCSSPMKKAEIKMGRAFKKARRVA